VTKEQRLNRRSACTCYVLMLRRNSL
jgi:hypothetical protein